MHHALGLNSLGVRSFGIMASKIELARSIVRSGRRVCVLTGAGISTDSGVPDYRSPGRPQVKSILYNQFVGHHRHRQRYWARSMFGYDFMSQAEPNDGHHIVTQAQQTNSIASILTQNVDGLHQKAGSDGVVELHGSIHEVVCLDCGHVTPRNALQVELKALNPDFIDAAQEQQSGGRSALLGALRPDGDSVVKVDYSNFIYPECGVCAGMLKPHVVFFGESLPRPRSDLTTELAGESDVMVVAGTSLAVWSAFRLVRMAEKNGCEIIVVTRGPTRADEFVKPELRFSEEGATEVLGELFGTPS